MKNLFDETTLGGVTLRNRAWRSATWLGLAGPRGEITDGIIRTYVELAKGGAAMLVTGLTSIAEDDSSIDGEFKTLDVAESPDRAVGMSLVPVLDAFFQRAPVAGDERLHGAKRLDKAAREDACHPRFEGLKVGKRTGARATEPLPCNS